MGGTAASFGYWVRRRRLALDLTQASLARRAGCSPEAIKKIERDERRPSRTMATRLADALGLPPDQQARFVAAGLGELAAERLGEVAAPTDPGPAPSWLSVPLGAEQLPAVGRDLELARLQAHLDAALTGKARVVFVTGEAGQGKTSLLTMFADRAQQVVPDLVVARGAGTAAGGYGDPYLAIRDLFRMLVVDPNAPWHADQLSAEQARRLWAFAPVVARTIVESGPHLLDVIVPADTVRDRLGVGMAPAGTQPSQDHVIAGITDVLTALAAERPLLLLLDDMQWADTASAELLFHLSRRLTDTRLLVVCAYRGSEVAEHQGPAAGTVRRALLEIRRGIDDAVIDLDEIDPAAERDFCDALLDLEFPELEPGLRDALYHRTRGNPLFVQELVRELKARGDLVRRADGSWTARTGLDWEQVPARVAVVIEQRLDRLGEDERSLLESAAVEGEQFTAETAAQVSGIDERVAHRLLSRQLDRTQGLVRETGMVRSGGRTLTRYRFSHMLFRRFAYDNLGDGARRSAHRQVAAEIETLHAADPEPVLSQLAHHYAKAGEAERAVPYLLQAGDRARLLYAHDEAVDLYEKAAGFLRELGDRERLARTVMKIGLTRQTGFDHDRAQQAFDRAFALWAAVGADDTRRPAGSATLRLTWAEPESLDPTMGGYTVAAPIVTNLISGLVRYDEDTQVVPDIAARWEISKDGRRYTFQLRHDVEWSDGRPVTAHDFAFTYRRALDPETGAVVAPALLEAVAGAREVSRGLAAPDQLGIHAVDDHTLVIELTEPTSYFIYNLAYYVLLPVPRHVVERHGTSWAEPPTMVFSGPFLLAEWEHDRAMVLERNPRYHGPARGNVSRVILNLTARAGDHENLYLADEIDVVSTAWDVHDDDLDRLRHRFPTEYQRRDRFVTVFYWLDPAATPLDDPRLRQAMAMAVDRGALRPPQADDRVLPATGGLVPPGMPGHVTEAALPYDPDEAARVVTAATDGDPLRLAMICGPRAAAIAGHLSEAWRAIGIETDFRVLTPGPDMFATWAELDGPKVAIGGWVADYPDPDTFLRVCVELDLPDWRHDRYWSLLDRAARTAESEARLAMYREAELILAREAVLVPLLYQHEHLMLKPWITEYPSIPVKYPGFWKDVVVGPR